MFYEIMNSFSGDLLPFAPYPAISDRDAWNHLDDEWRMGTVRLAESYLKYQFPGIPITLFLDFTRTGNRTNYENVLFEKRLALCALVLGECVENEGRFLDQILNGIFSICEESAWYLPAHNSYIRDTLQLPLPDASDPVLELFSCETGAILAVTCYLLEEKLDACSPFITKRIRYEIHRRIIEPYFAHHFWWMGNGLEPMCNWTIWCTMNILLSVFLTKPEDPCLSREILLKCCRSIDYFLDEYGEDGCCDEGAQYYHHAGLCLFYALEVLNGVTGNAFASLYQNPKIRNIAAYIFHVHIDDKYYVNFADCSPVAGRVGVSEYLFARRTGNVPMMEFAARDFLAAGSAGLLLPHEHNLYFRLQNGFHISEIRSYAKDVPEHIRHQDIYYPSVGLFIFRDTIYTLAVKAGDNDDSHNHNDTGSFTLYKNGNPFFIDIGVESYTKKTFSQDRYDIWTMQSAYHNLPVINGIQEHDGSQYRAEVLSYDLTGDAPYARMDLTQAYPCKSGLSRYIRKAVLCRNEQILIQDSFCFEDTKEGIKKEAPHIVLSLMTYEKPYPAGEAGNDLVIAVGSLGTVTIHGGKLSAIETCPIEDARLKTAWEHEIYRILITVTGSELQLNIR